MSKFNDKMYDQEILLMSMKMGRKENMKTKSFCVTEGEGRGIGILSIPTQLQGGGDGGEIKNTILIPQFVAFHEKT